MHSAVIVSGEFTRYAISSSSLLHTLKICTSIKNYHKNLAICANWGKLDYSSDISSIKKHPTSKSNRSKCIPHIPQNKKREPIETRYLWCLNVFDIFSVSRVHFRHNFPNTHFYNSTISQNSKNSKNSDENKCVKSKQVIQIWYQEGIK